MAVAVEEKQVDPSGISSQMPYYSSALSNPPSLASDEEWRRGQQLPSRLLQRQRQLESQLQQQQQAVIAG
jgi:23S rRNA A1618 N6-methylase RlmF